MKPYLSRSGLAFIYMSFSSSPGRSEKDPAPPERAECSILDRHVRFRPARRDNDLMPAASVSDLVQVINDLSLLLPAQLKELDRLRKRLSDSKALVQNLVQRGWLTT